MAPSEAPLPLLLALARLRSGKERLPFTDAENGPRPLPDVYAPPVNGAHGTQLPFRHLRNDGRRTIEGADAMPR